MDTIKKDLFDLFQLDKMSPEKSEEMLGRLSKLVFQSVLVRVLPTLSEEDLSAYEKIVESDQEADVLFKFLSEKVKNLDEIIQEEAKTLQIELVKDLE